MKRFFAILAPAMLLAVWFVAGCNNDSQSDNYGGEVKTVPGGKAPPPGKGGGRTPSID